MRLGRKAFFFLIFFSVATAILIPSDSWGAWTDKQAGDPVSAQDISELRTAINNKLSTVSCGATVHTWIPMQSGEAISSGHVNEIRSVLNATPFLPNNPNVPSLPVVQGQAMSADYMNRLHNAVTTAACGACTAPPCFKCDPVNPTSCIADDVNGTFPDNTCGNMCVGTCGNPAGVCDAGETCASCPSDCPCPCTVKVPSGNFYDANDCVAYAAWDLSNGCPDPVNGGCPTALARGGTRYYTLTATNPSSVPVRGSIPNPQTFVKAVPENFWGRDQRNGWDFCHYTACVYYETMCYPPVCGDSVCSGGETCASCVGDCGACPVCGNGNCEPGESCDSCDSDCGTCEGTCPSPPCLPEDCGGMICLPQS